MEDLRIPQKSRDGKPMLPRIVSIFSAKGHDKGIAELKKLQSSFAVIRVRGAEDIYLKTRAELEKYQLMQKGFDNIHTGEFIWNVIYAKVNGSWHPVEYSPKPSKPAKPISGTERRLEYWQ